MQPICFEPVVQKDSWDCGVACLRMLLGVSYADVRERIRYKNPRGLSVREMKRIAKDLGHPLTERRSGEGETPGMGILVLAPRCGRGNGHYVMAAKGAIYNPADNNIWTDRDAFFDRGQWKQAGVLLRRV